MTAGAPEAAAAERAVDQERRRSGRVVAALRLSVVSLALVLFTCWIAFTWPAPDPLAATAIGPLAVYWALALIVFLIDRHARQYAELCWWAVPVVDVAGITAVWALSARAMADAEVFAVIPPAAFCTHIMVARLSLLPRFVVLTALTVTASYLLTRSLLGATASVQEGAVVLIFFAVGALSWFDLRRTTALLHQAVADQRERDRLSRYFPPQVADHIIHTGQGENPGELREITILFADIRKFTSLAETAEVAKVVALLNQYYTEMVEVVFWHGGTLGKFIGDGVMAYFGAPLPQDDHAARAIRCAGDMMRALELLNRDRATRGEPPVQMGIGVNTGMAILGDLGPHHLREFTVIGDSVNVAARLEALTKEVGAPILVAESTRAQAGDRFDWTEGPVAQVRGRNEAAVTWVPRFDTQDKRTLKRAS